MGLLRTILLGRPNGIRSRIRCRVFGGAPEDTSPTSSHSAPRSTPLAAEPVQRLGTEPPRDVTPPVGFEVVLHKDSLKSGQVVEVIIAGTAIAVANVDGDYHATTNTCPHADGPLGEGELSGSVLTCPYHGWRFDVVDGSCQTNSEVTLQRYDVQIVGDAVCVRL